jgi:translation initiation factor IF-2
VSKKRVHELAKDYGLTGQELASKLRSLGFTDIKGPQSTLDEFTLLHVQGTLEANGILPAAVKPAEGDASGATETGIPGLVKKKKKRTSIAGFGDDDAPEAPAAPEPRAPAKAAPIETPLESAPTAATRAKVEAEPREPQPTARAASSAAAATPAPTTAAANAAANTAAANTTAASAPPSAAPSAAQGSAPSSAAAESAPKVAAEDEGSQVGVRDPAAPSQPERVAETPRVVEPAADVGAEVESGVDSEVVTRAPAPDSESLAPAASATEAVGDVSAPPAAGEAAASDPDIVRPAAKRRAGKVVGFVDLSKVQAKTELKKPESRRLRSKDDVAPNVQPTLGHDKRKALVRGDQASRGTLTATQLKEKEAGRFLRRKGAGPATQSPSPRGSRSRGMDVGSSPFSGGEVTISAPITIKKLAEALSIKVNQVLARVMENNMGMLTQNSVVDEDTAGVLALEFNVALKVAKEVEAEDELLSELVRKRTEVEEQDLLVRPPTVAILGHVDHGKTTLIDRLRNSSIAEGESGGITQHIGAYQVKTKSGHTITILDTPGHEAFTAMRARGAHAVDIVVLVVAADDGVMPSTLEALNHARAAKTRIVVAINKIDKPNANPQRVKEQLAKAGLSPEEWDSAQGVAMMPISGLTGEGVDEMLEHVFFESQVLELKSHSKGPASGVVLEAEVQEGKGRVAHLLVKDGTLNKGDVILAGEGYGRVRSMYDDHGVEIETAGPSMPVQVTGLSEYLPTVGDSFYVVQKLEQAREVAEERRKKIRLTSLAERKQITSENILAAVAAQSKKMINVILRADVQGSLQALEQQIAILKNDEVDVKLLQSGLGTVTESDVNLAATSNGIVLAFRVNVNSEAREAADRASIDIRPYDVIYELLDDLHQMMEGELSPEMTEQITGHAEVRAIFVSSKFGNIAGSHVIDGALQRDNKVRVLRKGKRVHESTLAGLRRDKDDVREVREGFDCGITVRDFDAFELGDVVEGYKVVAVKRKLARA